MTFPVVIAQLLQDAPSESVSFGGGGGSVLVVLFVLLVGCSVAVWFFIKRGTFPRMKGGENLQILETRVLGGRQFLVVGKHGDQKFLLGVCPGRIDYLCPLDMDAEVNVAGSFETVLQEKNSSPQTP